MNTHPREIFGMKGWRCRSLVVLRVLLVLAGAALLAGFFSGNKEFIHSYLFAWLFWSGISLGALVITMMQYLTGGEWGKALRPAASAALGVLPAIALLFIPILVAAPGCYGLAGESMVGGWGHKAQWMAPWFFLSRSILYLGGLSLVAALLQRWQPGPGEPVPYKVKALSAGGLIGYMVCMIFASTDWVMSLEPRWYSTIFGVILAASQFVGALSFLVLVLLAANRRIDLSEKLLNDLGNLLLAFVIFWIYVTFSQFLITWAGNLPKEISWYLRRREAVWFVCAMVGLGFGAPFLMLLSRAAKRRRLWLAGICLSILAGNVLNTFWFVMPSIRRGRYLCDWVQWSDGGLLLALGAIWFGIFFLKIQKS